MAKTLTVYLAADIGKFKRELRAADRETQGFAGGLKDKLGPALLAAGAAAGAVALKVGADAIQMGSAFEQAAGAADQLFGEAGSAAAQSWADQTATSMGLSMQAAIDAQNAFGAFALQAGKIGEDAVGWTQQLTQSAADLSAAFGGDVTEAVAAMSSAFRGSGEPLERYGVIITQNAVNAEAAALGFEKVAGSFDQQAKVLATTSLIQKQMDLLGVTGQNAREADTFAGATSRVTAQIEDLQTILGLGILDGMGNFGSSANDVSDALVKLEPLVRKTGEAIGSSISDYITLAGAVVDLGDAVQGLGDSFGPIGAIVDAVGTTVYRWANPISYTMDVFGRGEEIIDDFGTTAKNTGAVSKKAASDVVALGSSALDAGRAALAGAGGFYAFWQAALNAEKAAREASSMSGTVLGAIDEGFLKGPDPDAIRRMNAFQAEINKVNEALAGSGGSSGKSGGAAGAADKAAKTMESLREGLALSTTAFEEQAQAVKKAEEQLTAYADSISKGLLGGINLDEVFDPKDAAATLANFTDQIANVTAFSTKLADFGTQLGDTEGAKLLLSQVLALGYDAGSTFIDSLTAETAGNLVSQLDAAILQANATGYLLGETFFREGVNAEVQLLMGMQDQLEKDEKKVIKIGKKIGQPIGSEIRGQIAAAIDSALADASRSIERWKASNRIEVPRTSVNT